MHLPPEAAVFRVSQLTTSPASSLWKVQSTSQQVHSRASWVEEWLVLTMGEVE